MQLRVERPNEVGIAWGGLRFEIYTVCRAVDYQRHLFGASLPDWSGAGVSSPRAWSGGFSSGAGADVIGCGDIDAELHRQTGGDLSRGVCIDPARFGGAGRWGRRGGDGDGEGGMDGVEGGWGVEAGFGGLSLGGGELEELEEEGDEGQGMEG